MIKKILVIVITIVLLNSQGLLGAPPVFIDTPEDAFMLSSDTKTDLLIVFGASWCGPCSLLKKDIQDNLYKIEDIIICYIDIDKRPDLKKEYRVRIVPDYMIYRDNIEIKRKVGYNGKNDLFQILNR